MCDEVKIVLLPGVRAGGWRKGAARWKSSDSVGNRSKRRAGEEMKRSQRDGRGVQRRGGGRCEVKCVGESYEFNQTPCDVSPLASSEASALAMSGEQFLARLSRCTPPP